MIFMMKSEMWRKRKKRKREEEERRKKRKKSENNNWKWLKGKEKEIIWRKIKSGMGYFVKC